MFIHHTHTHTHTHTLGWCKSNCSFALLKFLNKHGYVIHHFNVYFLFYGFLLMTLTCFICTLDYGDDVRQKENLSDFLIQVQKCVVKSRGDTHNIKSPLGSGTAKDSAVVIQEVLQRRRESWKMRSTGVSHQKVTTTAEHHHQR